MTGILRSSLNNFIFDLIQYMIRKHLTTLSNEYDEFDKRFSAIKLFWDEMFGCRLKCTFRTKNNINLFTTSNCNILVWIEPCKTIKETIFACHCRYRNLTLLIVSARYFILNAIFGCRTQNYSHISFGQHTDCTAPHVKLHFKQQKTCRWA